MLCVQNRGISLWTHKVHSEKVLSSNPTAHLALVTQILKGSVQVTVMSLDISISLLM